MCRFILHAADFDTGPSCRDAHDEILAVLQPRFGMETGAEVVYNPNFVTSLQQSPDQVSPDKAAAACYKSSRNPCRRDTRLRFRRWLRKSLAPLPNAKNARVHGFEAIVLVVASRTLGRIHLGCMLSDAFVLRRFGLIAEVGPSIATLRRSPSNRHPVFSSISPSFSTRQSESNGTESTAR